MTLTEFLLARIAEDESAAREIHQGSWEDATSTTRQYDHVFRWSPARVLAECETKRRIVGRYRWADEEADIWGTSAEVAEEWNAALGALRDLAVVYADHPDYREEWKP